jgi:hypothetical protein
LGALGKKIPELISGKKINNEIFYSKVENGGKDNGKDDGIQQRIEHAPEKA